ncbi:uncharacterized protein [Spinacia oleracea]|uniref:tRNA/rRNA methyltransferase SpoU type domain-containing protein n=1 Tax=Spinacia oleracea TaxID=3562 RepID=A0ABM3R8I6_SPIOL|nr:uncharacterized protein LOC130467433 [Spinacia oleracea]
MSCVSPASHRPPPPTSHRLTTTTTCTVSPSYLRISETPPQNSTETPTSTKRSSGDSSPYASTLTGKKFSRSTLGFSTFKSANPSSERSLLTPSIFRKLSWGGRLSNLSTKDFQSTTVKFVQDLGNLGTLLRSALAFEWNGVFLLPGCCDPFNEKALRASRGALFQLPLVFGNWAHFEAFCNKVKVKMFAGHPDSSNGLKPVHKLSLKLAQSLDDTPLCLFLGSEGSGLTEKARQFCLITDDSGGNGDNQAET